MRIATRDTGKSKEELLIFPLWASRRDHGSAADDPVAVSAQAAEDLLHDAGFSSPNRCRIVLAPHFHVPANLLEPSGRDSGQVRRGCDEDVSARASDASGTKAR